MRGRGNRAAVPALAALALAGAACSPAEGSDRTVVASFYPLAFAAERLGGSQWRIVDLTPPGTEAHDIELTLEDRAVLEDADVVLYLGDLGFQPQVEEAAASPGGNVVAAADGMDLLEGPADEHESEEAARDEPALDPHLWLDPVLFGEVVDRVAEALAEADPNGRSSYRTAAEELRAELAGLDHAYRDGLSGCASSVMVVSHEAFAYLAERYDLRQVGLTGLTPEAEPTVERLGKAGELLDSGQAIAVFYEAGGESRRIAESVAGDFGVPALPLGTLESHPSTGDYVSEMESNLRSLRRGLGCE